ncbi:low affinity iron permease family protein [Cupriavidus necator]|uniref:Low affinity iron permease family protein n=1 Tax=Cupriavidus necator TaxID=106590 RepID=A0A367PG24_CUPNE|nr:low affinity iron permease family protein [Cupriavidus necator]QQX87173.1 low affinity iron permease family protein [Cupriavidus necator]RCJ05946.1 low affinity iron permease family protein [Cupriavidus necator]
MNQPSPIPPGVGHRPGSSKHGVLHAFDHFAGAATRQAGSPVAFVLAVGVVAAWAITGPLFAYSETWQLVINTGTTIVTFLMVFLIQQSQNKDAVAVHLKLNELLASHREASNMLVSIEDLDEEELRQLVTFYRHLAELADKENGLKSSHSLDEARENHAAKRQARAARGRRLAGSDAGSRSPTVAPSS